MCGLLAVCLALLPSSSALVASPRIASIASVTRRTIVLAADATTERKAKLAAFNAERCWGVLSVDVVLSPNFEPKPSLGHPRRSLRKIMCLVGFRCASG